jgi:hypothetical protein
MTLDTWILSLGIAKVEGDLDEDSREVLVASAENFLRSGGAVTLTEWRDLSDDSKAAFVTAGDRLRAVEAYMHGSASRSRTQGLAMLSKADGGDQYIRELLVKTTQIAASRIEKTRPVETPS